MSSAASSGQYSFGRERVELTSTVSSTDGDCQTLGLGRLTALDYDRRGRDRSDDTTIRGPISNEPRINNRIDAPEVRLVGPVGDQVGIVKIEIALQLARDAKLDLVEVAPMARPPIARLMDYAKYKLESEQKVQENRRNVINTLTEELKGREWP